MFPGTHARTRPDHPAVVQPESGRTVTYAELDDRSRRLAHVLRATGLRRGDHVAFVSDNAPEVFDVYWAALRSGLYVTGINHHLSADEAAYIATDCGARVLFASAATGDLAVAMASRTPGVERRIAFGGAVEGHEDLDDALAQAPDGPLPDQPRGADMLYSSGTTGRPKGIKPALQDIQVDEPGDLYTAVFGPMYGFGEDTVYYSPAPVYHAAPLRFGGIVHALGGTVVMARRFGAETALEHLQRYRVTHGQFVPTMFVRMLKLDDEVRASYDVTSLRVAVHAAAPCPVDVKQKMIDWWGPVLHEYYSSTEGNGVTFIDSETWRTRPGSVGRAGLGIIRICDDDGAELPTGEVGTVYFERETPAFEYHNAPEKTREGRHPAHENWSTTGDVGYLDADGYLFLTDRKAFMIISGGVNIYPQEVEDVLTLHPKVYDVAVVGIPDPEMGEQVKAVVQLPEGVEASPALEAELLGFVRERIAHYKAPRSVDFTAELPRSATGKLVKGELRRRYTEPAPTAG
ncbi:acyl-CoA synthetase [Pseudonocardia sp. EC080610-09]|uniref:acyl-CoA synthetase n=1 Tax=unclassified Pseudonocardia TaxID=2619320 RepID=UPI0006CB6FAA|nr:MULTISPECIES: acyl-CoA synthetase [unclassified Pseudonocardia]ALE75793.1 acyl-CoA synthetase [Pseudonocardia sp. EC080625-04]ALL75171.1 acyl-CoA synthetase [Pseudonocardia sp. EC080610-09]ALL82196.1 acyl-CoA synthetase [Pseudonocardia sp. EC080619-01]